MPEIKPTQTKLINVFVDKMMADKGLDAMGAEEQQGLRKSLRAKVEEQVERAMLSALTDAQLVELERMMDEGASDAELDKFFDESGADFDGAVHEAMTEFRKAFLNSTVGEA